jgi:hypothetical protein
VGCLLAAAGCGELAQGPKTASRDGYRAILSFSSDERFQIAVRGEKRRVAGVVDGSELVKVVRPDLGKAWQFRPSKRKLLEASWSALDEIVPGYPLETGFDPAAYADRFGGQVRRIGDAAHGIHPCDRYELRMPSGDVATIWVARDLERLVVRIEHAKKDPDDEYQAVTDTQLLDVRVGASEKLFEQPEGYTVVRSYDELGT